MKEQKLPTLGILICQPRLTTGFHSPGYRTPTVDHCYGSHSTNWISFSFIAIMVKLHATCQMPNAESRIHSVPFQKLISIMPDGSNYSHDFVSPNEFAHPEISFIINQGNTESLPNFFRHRTVVVRVIMQSGIRRVTSRTRISLSVFIYLRFTLLP